MEQYAIGLDNGGTVIKAALFDAAELAVRGGVLLGFETMENEFMNIVQKAMRYVSKVNSPYLNVYPDLVNLTNAAKAYGADVLADLESGRGQVDVD